MKSAIISSIQNKTARKKMARGVVASFLGMLVVACSGCGGGGGGSAPPTQQSAQPAGSQIVAATPVVYSDGRPGASYRLNATDQGIVLKHGDGPGQIDINGARDVFVYQSAGTYYMHYDGQGSANWTADLATSTDLVNWSKKGQLISAGPSGQSDSGSAGYATVYFDGTSWHMFYLGVTQVGPGPNFFGYPPYVTMKAKSDSPTGPWTKQYNVTPFQPVAGTYYDGTASPGAIVPTQSGYLQFFSAGTTDAKRTIGIARTSNLDNSWAVDPTPALPLNEQLENASIYYQESTKTWFMFVNHIGIGSIGEYADSIWVYWTQDVDHWNSWNKAVVLDGSNCSWSHKIIGLPSVTQVGNRLAIFYDGQAVDPPAGSDWTAFHMNRDIGLAWLDLPVKMPT
ncbi:hypothetical protein [Paraburkholderia fungorum]|uniref:hypothetical protein n=1 Tax=Paraburkholderia fungorum TaxID=134537 RepID=UPI00161AF4AD|nr:hypothetical protein [Paraburkholderia fungorum]MBB5547547.1 hypothetical protein [Paraburkholderia fungorum]